MTISIIIPTLNRPEQMIRLFERLNLVVTNEEVIVVDDSKANQNKELIEVANFDLTYIHRGVKLGVSSARNVGAESAKGDYLLFFDDDDDFTRDWLSDFRNSLKGKHDLIQCGMKVLLPNLSAKVISGANENWMLIIPGAWVLKKTVFTTVGGFDERLKYAENTEFFYRLDEMKPSKVLIEKPNFIYNQSPDGGSKNIQNMINSILIILMKHDETLSNHVKQLYHQILGVNWMRLQNYPAARSHLFKSWMCKPYKLSTLARLLIASAPLLAKQLYSIEVPLE